MSFVSAGPLEPSELLKPMHPEEPSNIMKDEMDDEEDNDDDDDGKDEPVVAVIVDNDGDSPMAEQNSEEQQLMDEIDVGRLELEVKMEDAPEEAAPPPGFVLDLVGDPNLGPKPRSSSPAPSNGSSSDSEKILFVPRNQRTGPSPSLSRKSSPPKKPTVLSKSVESRHEHISSGADTRVVHVVTTETTVIGAPAAPAPKDSKKSKPSESFISLSNLPGSSWNGKRSTPGNKRRGRRGGRNNRNPDDDREAIEDYMENIIAQVRAEQAESGPSNSGITENNGQKFNARDLGGDEWVDMSSTDEEEAASDDEAIWRYKHGWTDDDLADFDAIGTDSEGMKGVVDMILRKRTRPSGLQYLIKWEDESVDEATWVLAASMDRTSIKIKLFEEQEAALKAADSSSEDSDDEDEDEDDEDEDAADSDADFELAKLLQRQEELAFMGVDQAMSDMEAEIMGLEDDFFPLSGSKAKLSKKQRKRNRQNADFSLSELTPNRRTGNFPSATKLADAFDEFDLMDRDRLSILLPQRPNRKNKGKIAALHLSDSELEQQLEKSWEADRQKKKARKIQRQELRERGELGKKFQATGKPDMSAKYKEGMTLNEVFEEIRNFMMRDHTTYVFSMSIFLPLGGWQVQCCSVC